jgi:hypothetical protein
MADKIYTVELNEENISKLINKYNKLSKALSSMEFKEFLLEKCKKTRDEVMAQYFYNSSIDDDEAHDSDKKALYEGGNHEEISGDTITLYNDSIVDIQNSDTFFSEEYRDAFYPSELSLAELVEYGAGLVGENSSLNTGDEWEYQANSMRDYNEGWYYKNGEQAQQTMGSEGKYIYFHLKEAIEKNIEDWVEEYIEKQLGSGL